MELGMSAFSLRVEEINKQLPKLGQLFYLLNWTTVCCSVAELCLTLCNPMDCSTLGFPVLHYFLNFAQTLFHRVSDAIQPSHPLSSPSPVFNLSQHQGLFQWAGSLHQAAKVLELQLQHQSFQSVYISFSSWASTPPSHPSSLSQSTELSSPCYIAVSH